MIKSFNSLQLSVKGSCPPCRPHSPPPISTHQWSPARSWSPGEPVDPDTMNPPPRAQSRVEDRVGLEGKWKASVSPLVTILVLAVFRTLTVLLGIKTRVESPTILRPVSLTCLPTQPPFPDHWYLESDLSRYNLHTKNRHFLGVPFHEF